LLLRAQILIQELQFLLVTTFANLKTEKRQHKITPPRLQTSALYLCLLGLLNKTDARTDRMIFLSALTLARHRMRTKFELEKFQQLVLEDKRAYNQATGTVELIDHICCRQYLHQRVHRPRIATCEISK
jgi:hypothetical protein